MICAFKLNAVVGEQVRQIPLSCSIMNIRAGTNRILVTTDGSWSELETRSFKVYTTGGQTDLDYDYVGSCVVKQGTKYVPYHVYSLWE